MRNGVRGVRMVGALAFVLAGTIMGVPAAEAVTCPPVTIPRTPGERIKPSNLPYVYLVDERGELRWIPSATDYDNLFVDWNGIRTSAYAYYCMPEGTWLQNAYLVKSDIDPHVYLSYTVRDNYASPARRVRTRIMSPEVFNRYHFDWAKIRVVSHTTLISIAMAEDRTWD